MPVHTNSDLASWFRTLYLKGLWRRVGCRAAGRPIALYGAGAHTRRMLDMVKDVPDGPRVAVILDDEAGSRRDIAGIGVRTPSAVDPSSVAAIIVSTDTLQERLGDRARAWAEGAAPGERPEVVRLYDGMPDGPYETVPAPLVQQRMPGGAVTLRAAEPSAVLAVPRRAAEPAPGTIKAVTDQVTMMQTPSFRVHSQALRLEIPEIFAPHQLYPGSDLRPIDDIRNDDFITDPQPGLITLDTRVSVIGSCFAVSFKKWLVRHGYNFCQFEDGPMAYMGSVRAGPIFNTGLLRQLVEWAFDGFDPDERYWPREQWLFDPYRKGICWPDEASAEAERAAHFDAVRRMLRDSEVLIVTLGLSEVWRNRRDGCAFYLMPPPEVFDERRHEHALLSVDENVENLERFYAKVRAANPDLRLVLTLSPVPLLATYQDRHAVVADTVSKALLRVAIDEFSRAHPEVVYFPSYEIATRTPDWPYVADNRHIRPPIVDRIMATFIRHYGAIDRRPIPGDPVEDPSSIRTPETCSHVSGR